MSPSSGKLPEVKRWSPQDAALYWSSKSTGRRDSEYEDQAVSPTATTPPKVKFELKVKAFGGKELKCHAFSKRENTARSTRRNGKGFFDFLFGNSRKDRGPPSGANPSVVAREIVSSSARISILSLCYVTRMRTRL